MDEYEPLSPAATAQCKHIGAEFLRSFTRIQNVRTTGVAFMPLSVSTITFTGTYPLEARLPVERIRDAGAGHEVQSLLGIYVEGDKGETRKSRRKDVHVRASKSRQFGNCLLLRVRGKSIKLFDKGSIQVAGCGSAIEFLEIASLVGMFVAAVTEHEILLVLEAASVQMVNAGTIVVDPVMRRPMEFTPLALSRVVTTPADFEPERHPAFKIQFKVENHTVWTAFVFRTGNITFSAISPTHLADAYCSIAHTLDSHAHLGKRDNPVRTTTTSKEFKLVNGYTHDAYMSCLYQ